MIANLLDAVIDVLNDPPPVASVAATKTWAHYWTLARETPDVCVVTFTRSEREQLSRSRFWFVFEVEVVRARPYTNQASIEAVVKDVHSIASRLTDKTILERDNVLYMLQSVSFSDPIYEIDEVFDESAFVRASVIARYATVPESL
jgi:hypothetical protein